MAKVSVKFVFANSNATVETKVSKTSNGRELKALLFGQWPKAVPGCGKDAERVRLICLGRIINDGDQLVPGNNAGSSKLLRPDSMLPINVSIRPEGVVVGGAAAEGGAGAGATNSLAGTGKNSSAAQPSGKAKGAQHRERERDAIGRDNLGNTPALQEVCQCTVA